MKILGERLYSPPKMLCFQAKEPLSDEPLESLDRAPKEQLGILPMNLSGKRTELIKLAILRGQFTIVF